MDEKFTHNCDESAEDGGFPDCPFFHIQFSLWRLRSELDSLEKEITDLVGLPRE